MYERVAVILTVHTQTLKKPFLGRDKENHCMVIIVVFFLKNHHSFVFKSMLSNRTFCSDGNVL